MNKKENNENVVAKRNYIDNATLEEMNEKYPKVTVKGVTYELGLTYITLEADYFNNPNIRKLIKEHGAEIIAVICFFRMKMCKPYGWYCCVDEDSLDTLVEDCAYNLKMDEDKVRECYNALIDKKVFYVISDETGTYLSDVQQLYNFEILNNNRLRDRLRKQAARAKAQGQATKETGDTETVEQPKSVETTPAPQYMVNEEKVNKVLNDIADDENPFDW